VGSIAKSLNIEPAEVRRLIKRAAPATKGAAHA
jgi:hypothetical protein